MCIKLLSPNLIIIGVMMNKKTFTKKYWIHWIQWLQHKKHNNNNNININICIHFVAIVSKLINN